MRLAARLLLVLSALTLVMAPPGQATEAEPASASDNVRHVANLAYELRYGQTLPYGTDIELLSHRGRDWAFAGTYRNGLQIIDVTNPAAPQVAAVYDCAIAQGDVQVFTQGKRLLVGYTADDISSQTFPESQCYRDNGITEKKYGTFFVDVTNPRKPTTAGFVEFPKGSHNQTVHPSGNYVYNSNSDLLLKSAPAIEIYDISDLANPKHVTDLVLGTGLESHDITFNADGTRAYSAAVTHSLVIDTEDPANPSIIGRIIDPAINIHHQSDPITIGDRTLLVVTDELAGAAGNGFCPGGGLHIFDITGDRERVPVKVGFFDITDVRPTTGTSITCTSHVLRMYPDQQLMTIAWYAAGTRIIDLSGLADPIPTMAEVGHAYFDDSDTWSAKSLTVTRDGTFHVFANDIERGLDVFEVTLGEGSGAKRSGRWLTAAQIAAERAALPKTSATTDRPFCLLPVNA